MDSQIDTSEIVLEEIDSLPTLDDLMKELEAGDDSAFDDAPVVGGFRVVGEKSAEPVLKTEPVNNNQVFELKRKNEDLQAALRRVQSDFENYRRRIERERGSNYAFALTAIVKELLPVIDNFHLALVNAEKHSSEQQELQQFFSGFELILQQLEKVLNTMGVKPVAALGETFDPSFHDAVSTEIVEGVEPNTVVEEILRGYLLGNKLIRPAMVKVSINAELEG